MQLTEKRVLILDLDNTVFPTTTLSDSLFAPLFQLIQADGSYEGSLETIKDAVVRIPFQKIAEAYQFSESLKQQCFDLLKTIEIDFPIKPFDDYEILRSLPQQKFLVTTGFTKMQQSKIDQLGIENDFTRIYIVDPDKSNDTKKDIFQKIIQESHFTKEEVLVIGDDVESEIQAAKELGIDTMLYKNGGDPTAFDTPAISSYHQLRSYLQQKHN